MNVELATTAPEGQGPKTTESERRQAERPTAVDTPTKPNGEALNEAELHEVMQLEAIDQEVRQHEEGPPGHRRPLGGLAEL